MAEEEESMKKIERIILDLNKNGLSYLTNQKTNEAFEYFKKAQKTVLEQLKINPQHTKFNQLAGITFNNLACYYKKNNKPKVALTYLKKALQIQVYKVEDWSSTASTHLNICAIYSFLKKHQQAADHAELAISMLQKIDSQNLKESKDSKDEKDQGQKSIWNIKMLSHYNLAIELEHLKKYEQSKKEYQIAKEIAQRNSKKNTNLIKSIEQSINRLSEQDKNQKKKLIEILAKKREIQEKGNHEFMRKNKKNFGDQQWRSIIQVRKYELYKTDHQSRKNFQSSEKVKKLQPISDGSKSKRNI